MRPVIVPHTRNVKGLKRPCSPGTFAMGVIAFPMVE
jgi:hypothetical protein